MSLPVRQCPVLIPYLLVTVDTRYESRRQVPFSFGFTRCLSSPFLVVMATTHNTTHPHTHNTHTCTNTTQRTTRNTQRTAQYAQRTRTCTTHKTPHKDPCTTSELHAGVGSTGAQVAASAPAAWGAGGCRTDCGGVHVLRRQFGKCVAPKTGP